MRIIEILDDFWHRLKWFIKFVIGILMMGYFDLEQFFEKKKRKEGVK